MRLLPPNAYAADPSLRSLLRAWLSPSRLEWAGAHARDSFSLVVDGA